MFKDGIEFLLLGAYCNTAIWKQIVLNHELRLIFIKSSVTLSLWTEKLVTNIN